MRCTAPRTSDTPGTQASPDDRRQRCAPLRTEPGDPDESKTRTNASLDLYSGFDIVIKNLEIYGAHDRRPPQYRRDFEAQHGIDVAGVASLVICHNQIVNVLGDFVYFGASGTAQAGDRTASAYVDIYENYFHNAGRQGIAIVSGTDIAVRNNWIEEVARTALDIEPLSTHLDVANVTFDDNKVIGTRRFFSSMGAPAVVSNIVVKNNELIGSAMVIAIVGDRRRSRPTSATSRSSATRRTRNAGATGSSGCTASTTCGCSATRPRWGHDRAPTSTRRT